MGVSVWVDACALVCFFCLFGFWNRVCHFLEAHYVGSTDTSTLQSHICLCMSRAQAANTGHPFIHSHMDCENLLAPGPQACTVCIFFYFGVSRAHNCSLLWKDLLVAQHFTNSYWESPCEGSNGRTVCKDLLWVDGHYLLFTFLWMKLHPQSYGYKRDI